MKPFYSGIPLSFNRKAVRASASVTKDRNAIHSFTEVDITKPRKLIKEHLAKTGEKLSLTAYIVSCLARAVMDFPQFNSFIKGNKLIILDDITISVLIERELSGESVPEPVGIKQAQQKTYYQIHKEIREAQRQSGAQLGSLSNQTWIGLVPGFLLRTMIKLADKNIKMAAKYGKIAVTAVGMYSRDPLWFIPHGTATVLLTIGSIGNKVVEYEGQLLAREHLCLTVSFDHDIVDGAPAARFMSRLTEIIKNGELLKTDQNV